jgi:hypothetical protein
MKESNYRTKVNVGWRVVFAPQRPRSRATQAERPARH